jgi:hypothetical protein
VSRKPMALPDALVYELYGLTEDEIRIVEGAADDLRPLADSPAAEHGRMTGAR